MPRKPRPWFRFYVEAVHDRKLRRQPVAHRWLWVTVLALARQSPEPGVLYVAEGEPVTLEDLVDAAAITKAQTRQGMDAFERLGMVERAGDVWRVCQWDARQFEGDYSRSAIPEDVRKAVLARDGYECVECGATENLTIDHIVPVTKGGTDGLDNLQTLCGTCNSRKGNRERQRRFRERHSDETDNAARNVTDNEPSRVTPHARATESESEKEPTSGAGKPREPDLIFEALVEVCGLDAAQLTKSARGAVNKAAKELRDVGASPDGIRGRAKVYRQRWPEVDLTATALAKHYGLLGTRPPNGNGQPLGDPVAAARNWGKVLAEGECAPDEVEALAARQWPGNEQAVAACVAAYREAVPA